MRSTIRRAATVATATGSALALFTGVAAAHWCTNESLRGQAGEAYALLTERWELIEVQGIQFKGEKLVGGGFVDLIIDNGNGVLDAGDWVLADNMFLHPGLPKSALGAAGCGQGVGTAFPEEFDMEPCP